MKQITSKIGWPTRDKVGSDGTRSAWLLVQHADLNPVFQRKALNLMLPHRNDKNVQLADIAYLTDRVHVNEGKLQEYGTQFHTVEGVPTPRPIRKPEDVDKRRKAMGLSTLKEYTELMHT